MEYPRTHAAITFNHSEVNHTRKLDVFKYSTLKGIPNMYKYIDPAKIIHGMYKYINPTIFLTLQDNSVIVYRLVARIIYKIIMNHIKSY